MLCDLKIVAARRPLLCQAGPYLVCDASFCNALKAPGPNIFIMPAAASSLLGACGRTGLAKLSACAPFETRPAPSW